MKMKDLSAILIVFLFVVSLVGTVAGDVIIETDITAVGNCVINRELYIQTDPDYSGIKFYDNFWTPALGFYESSNVSLDESIELITYNDSVLVVEGGFEGENMKSDACLRNYDIGTRQSNRYSGNSIVDFEWTASNMSSVMIFAGEFSGRQRSTIMVKNLTDFHHKIYDEDLSIKGRAVIDLSSIIGKPVTVGEGDWLGCP